MEQWPGQVSLSPNLFKLYCSQANVAEKSKAELEKMIQLIEKCMLSSQNTTSVTLWMDYLRMLDLIDKTMEWTLEDKDSKKKGVLDRALEAVGHHRVDSG